MKGATLWSRRNKLLLASFYNIRPCNLLCEFSRAAIENEMAEDPLFCFELRSACCCCSSEAHLFARNNNQLFPSEPGSNKSER